MYKNLLFLLLIFVFAGCQSVKHDDELIQDPEQAYKKAMMLLEKGSYSEAADEFSKIYFQYPSHKITQKAEIKEAYSLYKAGMYDDAIDVIDNFILLRPKNKYAEYVYYLKGLCYFDQISDISHDQGVTENAKLVFEEFKEKFPGSEYVKEIDIKLALANDQLAAKEMEIGRYYLNRQNPIGAINRFQSALSNYGQNSQVPEALYRLAESFYILGINSEVNKYIDVLQKEYPENFWSKSEAIKLKNKIRYK